ncbi:Stk1 family PASTA domain-containing Ser/Thr kinase [Nocardioides sp.]|uniref:Stk1 family PASTA domain-containing Ser/Thr kinase n=1 Tax=Nocardioides sp. TaxID=35761 RepID=UPI0035120A5B
MTNTGEGTTGPVVGGRYQLGELLGRGGMAEVRKGTDTRLGRVVAVKRLRTDLASDATFQARFRREAQSSASLNHPSIVSVYDTGEERTTQPDGSTEIVPYIVMEYVGGRTLRDILREGRKILPERALEITSGVLSALDYSHRAGIIHRDIKPGNVMLTPAGDVKVMDFGIARAMSDAQSSMTQTAAVVGTAQYLSPEQARGETVDSRSDVYSAGCLLYELLTGRPPFVGDSPVAVAYQHVREPAVPPSRHEDDLTPDIDAIVMKSLAKRVEDRYQSASQMRADIERYLAGRPVQAAADGPVTAPTAVVAPVPVVQPTAATATTSGGRRRADDDRRNRAALYTVLAAVLVALIVFGAFVLPRLFDDTPTDVLVPGVIGLTLDDARQQLGEAGFKVDSSASECSGQQEAGRIVKQDPGARDYKAPGTTVNLTISTGACEFPMPSVTGQLREAAVTTLTQSDVRQGNITVKPCDADDPRGTVVEQTPQPGTSIDTTTQITLCVSDGPEKVPDVRGKTRAQAEQLIREAGFNPVARDADPTDSSQPRGRVTEQVPNPGETRDQGADVVFFVSTYVKPTPPPDADGDGLSDTDEASRGTNPNNPDSDGDGIPDGTEVSQGTDPLNPLDPVPTPSATPTP